MLNVFFTVDTEIWCGGWEDLEFKFSAAYRRYIYGPTRFGDYGLPFTLKMLNDHGLRGVFFVEPLFATRFGAAPLQEVVGLIQDAGQEVQLHLHTEWVDEALKPLLPGVFQKRPNLREFSRADQTKLIGIGVELLHGAGAGAINAFRAGNFGANLDTLLAVGENDLDFDSSYNGALDTSDIAPAHLLTQPQSFAGVTEYPVTLFRDLGPQSVRPLNLTACSSREMTQVLNAAVEAEWDSVVIVSHNFELLNRRKDRPDPIMLQRFRHLCRFLERHADLFSVRGFRGLARPTARAQSEPLRSRRWLTAERFAEQLARHAF